MTTTNSNFRLKNALQFADASTQTTAWAGSTSTLVAGTWTVTLSPTGDLNTPLNLIFPKGAKISNTVTNFLKISNNVIIDNTLTVQGVVIAQNGVQLTNNAQLINTVTNQLEVYVDVAGLENFIFRANGDFAFPSGAYIASTASNKLDIHADEIYVLASGQTAETFRLTPGNSSLNTNQFIISDEGANTEQVNITNSVVNFTPPVNAAAGLTIGDASPGITFTLDGSIQTTAWLGYTRVVASATTTTNTSSGIILISDNGGRPAYYNTTASTWQYVGTDVTVYTPSGGFNPTSISGCILWADLTSVSLGTSTWTDMSGAGNHGTIYGSPTLASTSGNGATAISTALSGGQSDYVSWIGKSILTSDYTCFTVTRYSGSHKERIWTGSNMGGGTSGWFTGHHSSKAGVGYANGWVNTPTDYYGTNWVISVQSPYYYEANGNASTLGTSGTSYYTTDFTCNGKQDGESSDFQTVEVIVYNNTIGSTDRTNVLNYLAAKYGITLGV